MRRRKERPIPSWGSMIGNGSLGLLMIFNGSMGYSRFQQGAPFWIFLVYLAAFVVGWCYLISSIRNGVRKWKSRHKATE